MKNDKKNQKFRYKATNRRGQRTHGVIEARNMHLAKALLAKQGLSHIAIMPAATSFQIYKKGIHRKQLLLTFQTLATLSQAGIVLTQALYIASNNTNNLQLSQILTDIKNKIESGQNFTQAVKTHAKVFGNFSLALIDAGERSGTLDVMLERIVEYYEKQQQLTQKLQQTLRYPAAVVLTAIIVVVVLLLKVVPAFSESFQAMGQELPLPTQIVLQLSNIVGLYFWKMVVALCFGVGIFLFVYQKQTALQLKLAHTSLKLPLFGKFLQSLANARFSRTLAITFDSGIDLLTALDLAIKSTNHPTYQQALIGIKSNINTGSALHEALQKSQLFTPMSIQMIRVGEASGNLVSMLSKVADYHEQEVDHMTKNLLSILEPLIILGLGLLVGGIVLAMYLPIFTLGEHL